MRRLIIPLCAFSLLLSAAPEARAQVRWGGQVTLADDTDLGLGMRVLFGLDDLARNLTGAATLDLFFPDSPAGTDLTYWELNLDGQVPVSIEEISERFGTYVGTGLNIAHSSLSGGGLDDSDTKIGFNILAGSTFNTGGRLTPFAEIRIELFGGDQFLLIAGILF